MTTTSTYLSAVDDAICEYQNETLEARGAMVFIRELDHQTGGYLGELLNEDTEPPFRAILGLAKSFEDAAAKMCDQVRAAETAEHERGGAG